MLLLQESTWDLLIKLGEWETLLGGGTRIFKRFLCTHYVHRHVHTGVYVLSKWEKRVSLWCWCTDPLSLKYTLSMLHGNPFLLYNSSTLSYRHANTGATESWSDSVLITWSDTEYSPEDFKQIFLQIFTFGGMTKFDSMIAAPREGILFEL